MLVALADSLFLSIDPSAARGRVLLFLVISFAPFLVIAPLIGPVIDRAAGGRRTVIQLVAGARDRPGRAHGALHRQRGAVPARLRLARSAEDVPGLEAGVGAIRRTDRGRARRGQLQARLDRRAHRLRGDPSGCADPDHSAGRHGNADLFGPAVRGRARQCVALCRPTSSRRVRSSRSSAISCTPGACSLRRPRCSCCEQEPGSCSSSSRSGCVRSPAGRSGSAPPSACRRSARWPATASPPASVAA